jgi:hypothetical protein
MAWSENASITRHRETGLADAEISAEDLKQRLEEFGFRLQQLKEREPAGPSKEWLEEAERRHQRLKTSLEDYRRERAEQSANESAWDTTKRQVQTNFQSLQDYTKAGAHNVAEGFRKSWDGVTNAFNRAFGRDQEQEPGPRVTRAQEKAQEEDPWHRR